MNGVGNLDISSISCLSYYMYQSGSSQVQNNVCFTVTYVYTIIEAGDAVCIKLPSSYLKLDLEGQVVSKEEGCKVWDRLRKRWKPPTQAETREDQFGGV